MVRLTRMTMTKVPLTDSAKQRVREIPRATEELALRQAGVLLAGFRTID